MGRITSNIGLITGIPITDTVDQLIQVSGVPRDLLVARTGDLQSQQLAISTLSTRLLAVQFDLNKLATSTVFESREVSSSNSDLLSAAIASGAKPPVGQHKVRIAQTATTQQLVTQRFDVQDLDLGTGIFSFGFGGFVDQGILLEDLNDGAGVPRGKIRITDRSGATADIDLTTSRSVDDVLAAINNNSAVNVTASTDGDTFVLTDNTGSTASNLIVQEVGIGTTAEALGLGSINVAANSATGSDVFQLHSGTKLSTLNDGNGVRVIETDALDDIQFSLISEETLTVDLSGATTIGDVVDAINALDGTKLEATIAADGNGIDLEDKTSGSGTFSVSSLAGSAAEDLGLTETAAGGTISGARLVSGLRDTLVSSLKGGQGLTLGQIDITNRSNVTTTVDLSSAETLDDIVSTITSTVPGVTAAVNSSRNGILLSDTTGASLSNFIVANNGASTTADDLGIAIDSTNTSVDGGSLHRQLISESTRLSSLNGGEGVDLGDIRVTNSDGVALAADLNSLGNEAKTVGDVIDAINALGHEVTARINDTGDGILITDTSSGSGTLVVTDISGNIAKSLNLTRASTKPEGQSKQFIDGTSRFEIDLADLETSPTGIVLSSLNNGTGVIDGDIRITDSQGKVSTLDLNNPSSGVVTISDLIDLINSSSSGSANVAARINDSGDGIFLEDRAGGTGELLIEDVNGSSAANLKLTGPVSVIDGKQTVNGVGLFSTSSSQNELEKLADRINELGAGATAGVIFDGVGHRLTLASDRTGSANQLLVDTSKVGLQFQEVAAAQDALLVLGDEIIPGSGILVASSDNSFDEVIGGLKLDALAPSDETVTVNVATTDADLIGAVEDFVDSYNAVRSELDDLTVFDETQLTTGLLFGTNEALRVDTELSRLITNPYFGLGSFESLGAIGLSVDDQGKLQLDTAKLQDAFAEDPVSLQTLFTDETRGIVAKFDETIERLAGEDNGLLTNRTDALQATIDTNQQRIDDLNASLERERERLLLQFAQLEEIIAGLQQNLSALDALQPIPPLSISRRT